MGMVYPTLQAEHLPGNLNIVADMESRTAKDRCDWMINPIVFQQIQHSLGPLEIDLFASRLTKQLPRYYSWRPDPEAEAMDAFLQNWAQVRGFANFPWCLIPRCLSQIKQQEAVVVLITPLWPCQSWFPVLLGMLQDYPRRLPSHHDLILNPSSQFIMQQLRQSFTSRGISTQASDLLLSSWRDKTNTSYNSLFAKWADWCEQRSRDPTVGPVEDVVNFLAELFAKGYQYRSLNAYRSAISSIHQKVDGQDIGQHPLVCRLLKGSYNQNPPTPRYSHFWDVGVVLRFFGQLGTNASLPLKWISIKTAMLMALTRPSRSADLSKLDIRFWTYTAKGVIFQPTHLSKQSRSSKPIKEFFFPLYTTDENICPVRALQAYEGRTASFRENNNKSTLFLSWIGKHDPVSSSTIARWLRTCLQEAGINTDTFKAHSVRGAASSSAAWSGVTTLDILNAADWSSETTYQQFYHRDMQDRSTFGSAVLSSASTSNLHVDMETEPSEM